MTCIVIRKESLDAALAAMAKLTVAEGFNAVRVLLEDMNSQKQLVSAFLANQNGEAPCDTKKPDRTSWNTSGEPD